MYNLQLFPALRFPRPKSMAIAAAGDDLASDDAGGHGFKLLGFKNFVRRNLRSDRFPVSRFHHLEFWTSDATNAARRFSYGLGMPLVAKSDLSTGNLAHASYLIRSSQLQFLFSAAYSPAADDSGATAAIPSFSVPEFRNFVASHGLAVRAVAVEVADAGEAYRISVANGARPAHPPVSVGRDGDAEIAEISLYGDVVLRFVSLRSKSEFLPRFEPVADGASAGAADFGLRRLDHAVGNVPELAPAVEYIKRFTGFHKFAEFTAEDVGTAESGLNSVVLANNEETVLLPLNEPVAGTKRRSQIQTYLDHNEGPGVQHLALSTDDVFATLRAMQGRSGSGGFDFMPAPPPTYYRNLRGRAGDVLTEEQMKECEELGLLVDRDDQGLLLQIFTKPVGDRYVVCFFIFFIITKF